MRKYIPLLIILLLLNSCSKNTSSNYEYTDGIKWFLDEEFGIKLSSLKDEQMLFINVSCEDCIYSKVNFLNQTALTEELKIFFLGDTTGSRITRDYNNENSLYDLNSNFYDYETGISGPLFLSVEKGIIVKHIQISDENQQEIITFLKEQRLR